jgi:hypothetical protein
MNPDGTLLDPTSEIEISGRARLAKPKSLDGLTVALLDISKPRGDVFLDRLEQLMTDSGIVVRRYMKPSVAWPAPVEIQQAIAQECDIVVKALAD